MHEWDFKGSASTKLYPFAPAAQIPTFEGDNWWAGVLQLNPILVFGASVKCTFVRDLTDDDVRAKCVETQQNLEEKERTLVCHCACPSFFQIIVNETW